MGVVQLCSYSEFILITDMLVTRFLVIIYFAREGHSEYVTRERPRTHTQTYQRFHIDIDSKIRYLGLYGIRGHGSSNR